MATPNIYEDWTIVFSSSTDYEADLVRDRLGAEGLDAVVLTHRDHAFNLNVGDLSGAHVLTRPSQVEEARALLASNPLTDAELEEAALSADPVSPDAEDEDDEASLDSGMESIRLTFDDEDDRAER
jgi:glyoxylase-like metal-dependent hydrolase (beta-lactamase superfamily II)